MNRKAFFRALILGGIVLPHVPKLILTGGWMPRPGEYVANGFRMTLDPNPLRFDRGLCKPLTLDALIEVREMMLTPPPEEPYDMIVSPIIEPEIRGMMKLIWKNPNRP